MTNVSQRMQRLARPCTAGLLLAWLAGCGALGTDRGVVAEGAGAPRHVDIPESAYPPRGKCRIWVPGMAPGLQSAPDDCDRLKSMVPKGAVLIRG